MFLTLCIAVLSMTLVQAQERTYTGTVSSAADGSPIIGANVEVVGTTVGTSTGVDGSYSIRARSGSQLRFSYLGMQPQVITVGSTTSINVVLVSDATDIEDVVVVAYGTVKKKDLTGSISSVGAKTIEGQSNSTVSKVLEGSVPGVRLSASEGQPGEDAKITIRGVGTANHGQSYALVVIDGVPASTPNALSSINPKDIESMVVSKDAASNSLYGSRGANGVVFVTTKTGSGGKPRVSFDARVGVNNMINGYYDIQENPGEIYKQAWHAIYNKVRYSSNVPMTTNALTPNTSHEKAAEFASAHLFDYNNGALSYAADGTVSSAAYARNNLYNWMLYDYGATAANFLSTGTSSTLVGKYLVGTDGQLNPDAKLLWQDDWRERFFEDRFRQEYNISVSGSSADGKTDYFISAGYQSDPSYYKQSKFSRYNARVNVNTQVTKWLKAGLNAAYARRDRSQAATRWGPNPGSATENLFWWTYGGQYLKAIYARDEDGNYIKYQDDNKDNPYTIVSKKSQATLDFGTGQTLSPLGATGRASGTGRNPAFFLDHDKWQMISDDITMRGQLEATFLRDFKARANLSMDNTYDNTHRYVNATYGAAAGRGDFSERYQNYLAINSQQMLEWSKDFGKHHIDVTLGHEYWWYQTKMVVVVKNKGLIDDFDTFGNFIGINGTSTMGGSDGSIEKEALEGYFARANYNYDNKYYLTATVRRDGSSKFKDKSDKWGTFWSVGGAWRISSESFMEGASSWMNDLKLRASYGTMGNMNGVSRTAAYTLWNHGNSGTLLEPVSTVSLRQFGNPDLSWEIVKTLDVGVDFRFWDRFYGVLDFFVKNTDDMIWSRPTAPSIGVSSVLENSASMRNIGFEWDLGVDIIRNKDWQWSVNVNGTHYKTTLESIPFGVGSEALGGNFEAGDGLFFLRGPGKPYFNTYTFIYEGVDPNTGLALYRHTVSDLDHVNGRFTDNAVGTTVKTTNYELASRYESGDAIPDVIGGFGTNLRWKDFDLGVQFAFQLGGKFLSKEYGDNFFGAMNGIGGVLPTELKYSNRWTPENTTAEYPMLMLGLSAYHGGGTLGSWMYSNKCLHSASYLSLKNVTLGYSLPQRLMDRWGMGGVRVYVSADNLFLLTAKEGIDPRMSLIGGIDVGAYVYPQLRTMSVGVNVTF